MCFACVCLNAQPIVLRLNAFETIRKYFIRSSLCHVYAESLHINILLDLNMREARLWQYKTNNIEYTKIGNAIRPLIFKSIGCNTVYMMNEQKNTHMFYCDFQI